MLTCVVLEHDHVVRCHTKFGAQDVGSQVPDEVAGLGGNSLDPLLVARFPARPDAMGDHGRDVNAGIHEGEGLKNSCRVSMNP